MEQERPITRDSAEPTVAALEAFMASGVARTEIDVLSARVTIERNDDGGFTVLAPGQVAAMRLFPRLQVAPSGYDAGLPYVPDEVVMVSNATSEIITMVWLAPREPEATYLSVGEQTLAQGWRFFEDAEIPRVRRRVYRKGSLQREVMISEGIVSLVSRPSR